MARRAAADGTWQVQIGAGAPTIIRGNEFLSWFARREPIRKSRLLETRRGWRRVYE
jgi:hypothetical protein